MITTYSALPGAEKLTGQEILSLSQLIDGVLESRRATITEILALAGGGEGGLPEIGASNTAGTVTADEFGTLLNNAFAGDKPEVATTTSYTVVVKVTPTVSQTWPAAITVYPTPKGRYLQAYGYGAFGSPGQNAAVTAYLPDGGAPVILSLSVNAAVDGSDVYISKQEGNALTFNQGLFVPIPASQNTTGFKIQSGNWATNYGDDFTKNDSHRKTATTEIWKTTLSTTLNYNTNWLLAQPTMQGLPADADGIVLPYNLNYYINSSGGNIAIVLVLVVQGSATQLFNPTNGNYTPLGVVNNTQYDPSYSLTYWWGTR